MSKPRLRRLPNNRQTTGKLDMEITMQWWDDADDLYYAALLRLEALSPRVGAWVGLMALVAGLALL